MRHPRDERAVLNGLDHRLSAWDAEPGAPAFTLVLLHGFLDLSRSFEPLVAAWPGALPRTVALDFRGHGDSAWVGPEAYYHFPDYVADLHALLARLSAERLMLVGHSMGGTVAAMFAGSFPGAVARLAVIEGLGPPPMNDLLPDRVARWIREVNEVRSRPRRPMASVAVAAERLLENNPRMGPALAARLAELGTRPHDGGVVWSFDPRHRTRSPLPFNPALFAQCLARIDCPVLLVEGAQSGFRFSDYAERRAALPEPPLELTVPGAGHMVHQDAPAALAKVLAAFFSVA